MKLKSIVRDIEGSLRSVPLMGTFTARKMASTTLFRILMILFQLDAEADSKELGLEKYINSKEDDSVQRSSQSTNTEQT